MFKLSYTNITGKHTWVFNQEPTIKDIRLKTGCLLDSTTYENLKTNGYVGNIFGFFEIAEFKIPKVAQLQEAWKDWNNVFSYEGIRFGQYVCNVYNYEVGNSYNETNASKAYHMLFNGITESLDDIFNSSIQQ